MTGGLAGAARDPALTARLRLDDGVTIGRGAQPGLKRPPAQVATFEGPGASIRESDGVHHQARLAVSQHEA
jgi:hypothetical protein